MGVRPGHRSPLSGLGGSLIRIDSAEKPGFWTRNHDHPPASRRSARSVPLHLDSVAIDTETMGLHPHRDRLCVVQMSNGDGSADIVQIPKGSHRRAEPEGAMLADPKITKDLSFRPVRSGRALQCARGDAAAGLLHQDRLPADCRTYTDRHGLKDLVREVLNIDLSKQQQSSDWGAQSVLSEAQLSLCGLRRAAFARACANASTSCLLREGRTDLAQACFGVSSDPGQARPGRLGYRGHFRAFVIAG